MLSQPSRLPQLRARHGWSQADLAARTGVSRTEISAIEIGRVVPSVAVALRLAETLGASVEAIFGRGQASVSWAWPPASTSDTRLWSATMHGTVLSYPVEPTAAGVIPHDGVATADGPGQSNARPDRTLVIAGCDPLVGLLVHEMAAHHDIRVLPLLRSSTEALDLLKRGLVHAAGVHFTNDDESSANDQMVRARLDGRSCLLHQVRWMTGVALGPQRRERDVRALLRAKVRWVNREEGSAARRSLDRLLGRRPRPAGYERVVRDHRAVASAVSSGWADAGVCVHTAAADANVAFIPLHAEAYELCVPEPLLDDPRIVALQTTLRSRRYRQWLSDVPGCVTRDTSTQRIVG